MYGFQSPCDSKFFKNVLEEAKRDFAKPFSKKKNLLLSRRYEINRFTAPNANLSDLRLATICVTAYTAFLSYINKLASLRCRDVSFCDSLVKIYVYKSKADAHRDGA